jgi:hypothetical protein
MKRYVCCRVHTVILHVCCCSVNLCWFLLCVYIAHAISKMCSRLDCSSAASNMEQYIRTLQVEALAGSCDHLVLLKIVSSL